MSMRASIDGRLAFDPDQRLTKSGKTMTRARVAVTVSKPGADPEETLWLDLLAFGPQAERLAGLEKGQIVSAMGPLTRERYTARDGTERESWALIADGLMALTRPKRTQAEPAFENDDSDIPF